MWYMNKGNDNDVVLSTRVRLARNISGYPFPEKLGDEKAKELIGKIKAIFDGREGWTYTDMASTSEAEKSALAEKHVISREFAEKKAPSALISNDERGVYIMVLEDDHLRIQSVVAGYDLADASDAVYEAEGFIDEALEIAYSEKLGYITHSPANLGTGMRASVMLHLPAYTDTGRMRSLAYQLTRMGFTVRGMGGEGSAADAYIYQISNEVNLGMSEDDIIAKLDGVIRQIIARERELRGTYSDEFKARLEERARRDVGVMMYAGRLSLGEGENMYSELRLASAMDLSPLSVQKADELLISIMPGVIAASEKEAKTQEDIDRKRAKIAADILSDVKFS